ncbi:PAS domain S-box protein [Halosolutus amylolyticus]|uniref:histidine kinase n=1 Tax=Halosolutus amylolyticus TaxID=2932267 RepID=A0ABD5PQU0_9EURY|nr:PAS domain S-box protein [Halosolutus amylolyticus]
MTARVCCLVADPVARRETVDAVSRRFPAGTVTATADPDEVLERVEVDSPDCVVLDHESDGLDAVAVLDRLREGDPSVPVLVFPRDGSEALASDVLGAGATDYVRRADGYDVLVDRIERAASTREQTETPSAASGSRRDPGCCAILDAIGDAAVVYDPADGTVVDVNERLCELAGCRHDAACACSIERFRTDGPGRREAITDVVQRTLESGTQQVEWRCETAGGDEFWAEATFERVDRDGRPLVVALFRDVSERKRRKQRLRSFRQAIERAGHSIYITDPDGTIQYVNPAFERVTGYSSADAIGNTPRMLKSGVHDRAFYRELWETILGGDVWENQLVNRRKDGETYVVNQTIAPITNADGEIENFVAVNADISAQKRRERQLRRLHDAVCEWLEADTREAVAIRTSHQLSELLDLELNGVFLYDETADELEPAAVSERADAALDAHPRFGGGDGIARQVFETGREVIHDDVRAAETVSAPESPIRSEIVLPLGDHGVLVVGSRSTDAFDESDVTLARVVASSLEATLDRLGRERELERQKDRFEKFASVVSHDLRNPLTVAMGELERARDLDDPAAFERVQEAHGRMVAIIDDLLSLAREGKEIDDREPIPIAQVVTRAWDHVDAPTASFELDCDPQVRVLADPGRLQQLFENLFRNAVEHGSTSPASHPRQDAVEHGSASSRPVADDAVDHGVPTGDFARSAASDQPTGTVDTGDDRARTAGLDSREPGASSDGDSDLTITVGCAEDGFYVADDGRGIPESERDAVLETGYTTADDGTGLGLSIVTTIVDSHGWSIEVTESAAGGARFDVRSGFVD